MYAVWRRVCLIGLVNQVSRLICFGAGKAIRNIAVKVKEGRKRKGIGADDCEEEHLGAVKKSSEVVEKRSSDCSESAVTSSSLSVKTSSVEIIPVCGQAAAAVGGSNGSASCHSVSERKESAASEAGPSAARIFTVASSSTSVTESLEARGSHRGVTAAAAAAAAVRESTATKYSSGLTGGSAAAAVAAAAAASGSGLVIIPLPPRGSCTPQSQQQPQQQQQHDRAFNPSTTVISAASAVTPTIMERDRLEDDPRDRESGRGSGKRSPASSPSANVAPPATSSSSSSAAAGQQRSTPLTLPPKRPASEAAPYSSQPAMYVPYALQPQLPGHPGSLPFALPPGLQPSAFAPHHASMSEYWKIAQSLGHGVGAHNYMSGNPHPAAVAAAAAAHANQAHLNEETHTHLLMAHAHERERQERAVR